MRIELRFQPDDPAVAPLRHAWQEAGVRYRGRHRALAHVARERVAQLRRDALPPLARESLDLIPDIADLLDAKHWQLDARSREDFAGALAYFIDANDLIPDDSARVGYLDDALVVKLALASATHEWAAWRDYREYLATYPEDAGIDRETWLVRRRERLERDLRKRNAGRDYAPSGRRESAFADAGRYAGADSAPSRFGVR